MDEREKIKKLQERGASTRTDQRGAELGDLLVPGRDDLVLGSEGGGAGLLHEAVSSGERMAMEATQQQRSYLSCSKVTLLG
jgi:hypothetical protein